MTLNLSGDEICSVNTEEFWFERCPAKCKVLSVVPWAYFERKKLRSKAQWFDREIPAALFNRHPKKQEQFFSVLECEFLNTFASIVKQQKRSVFTIETHFSFDTEQNSAC